jgi:succinate dehydrogenase / fumarate reductase cytochrome b subunit
MHRNTARPLSPHLTIWRWGPHMAVSILNRVTGVGLSVVGAAGFVWWLVAAATGPEAYNSFLDVATGWFGILVGVGLTWALVFHTGGGIRPLRAWTSAPGTNCAQTGAGRGSRSSVLSW